MKRSKIKDLPSGIGVTANSNGDKSYWRVRLGKKFTGGKIVTRNFADLSDARQWIFGDAQKLVAMPGSVITLKETSGASGFALSPKELAEAADAFRRCKEVEITLTEAVSFAVKHYRPSGGKITVTKSIDALIAWKRRMGKRDRYLEKLEEKLTRFAKSIPAKTTLNEVTRKTVDSYLAGLKQAPGGVVIEMRHLSVLFGWGVKKGYAVENPLSKMEKPKVDRKPPTIFKPGVALELLKVAGELTPWIALGLFAGLRPEETQKLAWEDIDFTRRHVDLPAAKAKDRTRRVVPFFGNLDEWLLPYRQEIGLVTPKNFRKRFWAMCIRAGFRAAKDEDEQANTRSKKTEKTKDLRWPKDVLRHCFGSYHLAMWHSSGSTAEYMGHRDAKMLYNHYRDVIKDEAEVKAFWKLHPKQLDEGGKVIKAAFSAA